MPRQMPDPEFARELEQHRRYLMRVAQLQLRDGDAAQDVVQETLLAALAGTGFSGRSSLRTWLTGILKHKIVDAIRRRQRDAIAVAALDPDARELDLEDLDALFREDGSWDAAPGHWANPEQALAQRQFLDVLDVCLDRLPAATARVFVMREVMELETGEICTELGISPNNLWVMLYRARMALRLCLDQNWFANARSATQ